MAAPQNFVLRVHVATDVALKMTLMAKPGSVDELVTIMREKFKPRLDLDFSLQYEDPYFDGQLCCLVDIQELPRKAVLKVVRTEGDANSTGTDDTEILPHVPLSARQQRWPDVFPVPSFSYEVEYNLVEGNLVSQRSGKPCRLTRAQKHEILENMARTIHTFTAYPSDQQVGQAAEALVGGMGGR